MKHWLMKTPGHVGVLLFVISSMFAGVHGAAVIDTFSSSSPFYNLTPGDGDDVPGIQRNAPDTGDLPYCKVGYRFSAAPDGVYGPSQAYDITAAVFAKSGTVGIQFELWTASGNFPDTQIAVSDHTTDAPSSPTYLQDTITATLSAGVTYYLVVSAVSGSGTATSFVSNNPAFASSAYVNYYDSTAGSWTTMTHFTDTVPGAFSITAVPEPGAYAMIAGLGLLGFGAFRRFSR